jgi:hypothetical protein
MVRRLNHERRRRADPAAEAESRRYAELLVEYDHVGVVAGRDVALPGT